MTVTVTRFIQLANPQHLRLVMTGVGGVRSQGSVGPVTWLKMRWPQNMVSIMVVADSRDQEMRFGMGAR